MLLMFSVKPKLGSLLYRTTGALSAKQVYNYQNDPLLAILISPLFNFSNFNTVEIQKQSSSIIVPNWNSSRFLQNVQFELEMTRVLFVCNVGSVKQPSHY